MQIHHVQSWWNFRGVKRWIKFYYFYNHRIFFYFVYFWGGYSACVGLSFAYVAHLVFLRDVWIRTKRAAAASRCYTNLATHLPNLIHPWSSKNFDQSRVPAAPNRDTNVVAKYKNSCFIKLCYWIFLTSTRLSELVLWTQAFTIISFSSTCSSWFNNMKGRSMSFLTIIG